MLISHASLRACILCWALLITSLKSETDEQVDFNRDIRPILSDKCFHCHGPDAKNQSSELRLDTFEHATKDLGDYAGLVPGDADASELIYRVETDDDNDVMPPTDSNRSLSDRERSLLRKWVDQGGKYDKHWSFKPPVRPEIPADANGIDHLVRKKLETTDLKPSKRAPKHQLIRRVTLDLTGLPPLPEHVDAFVNDDSSDAYIKVVDRLLASPAYGERMAKIWLDAARYADSGGYQNDIKRTQWPWRDWVIKAYNDNMPFDQFSIEQLAGDLLPDADDNTRLATAFNRNHRINNEGGIIPAEFLVEYVADRVETTSTVWLGLTTGCARCHDHKYDPISMEDFYSLFAFFHNIPEKGRDGTLAPAPNMKVLTGGTKTEHEDLKNTVTELERKKAEHRKVNRTPFNTWKKKTSEQLASKTIPKPIAHYSFDFPDEKTLTNLAQPKAPATIKGRDGHVRAGVAGKFGKAVTFRDAAHIQLGNPFGRKPFPSDKAISWSFFVKPSKNAIGSVLSSQTTNRQKRGYRISLVETDSPNQLAVQFRLVSDEAKGEEIEVTTSLAAVTAPSKEFTHVTVTYDGSLRAEGAKIYINGQPADTSVKKDNIKTAFNSNSNHLAGSGLSFALIDELYIHRSVLKPSAVAALAEHDSSTVLVSLGKLRGDQNDYIEAWYYDQQDPGYRKLLTKILKAKRALFGFEKKHVTQVSIMQEMDQPRDTYLLTRGVYDQPDTSKKLEPRTFSSLPPLAEGEPNNRLGLARWLFQDDNPLTARVAVNRYWQMLFGNGLVDTPEDFGTQGTVPTNPELLDWLALEFRHSGWDVKGMMKRIVTSETYCQDSRIRSGEDLEIDPNNKLLARGPRFRLDAFALRDQALAASGLLVDKRGGPPVMPYQPAGLWKEVSAKGYQYIEAKDEGLYRRSLYTFWRRTVPPPSMMNFDSSGREICSVNTSRTNTPLQAMNLLNDPQFVEAARALGERMMKEPTAEKRIQKCSQLLMGRPANTDELTIFEKGYEDYLKRFRESPESAASFISVGNSKPNPELPADELAACAAIATIIMNLDETVTKE